MTPLGWIGWLLAVSGWAVAVTKHQLVNAALYGMYLWWGWLTAPPVGR